MQAPSVYDYLDFRAFLRAWLDHRRAADPAYTFETFAEAAGCSKAALPNVLGGQRSPRASTLDAFARAMGLDARERATLGLLVELDRAGTLEHRRAVMDRLLSTERHGHLRTLESTPEDATRRFLSDWRLPAIRELLSVPGARFEAAWIAAMLEPPMSVDDAEEALDTLRALGLVTVAEDGTPAVADVRIASAPDVRDAAIVDYHRRVVPDLAERLGEIPHTERHLVAAAMAVPEGLLPEIKNRLHQAVVEIATLADVPDPEPRRVYHLALQFLPISGRVG